MKEIKIAVVGIGGAGNAVVDYLIDNDKIDSDNIKYITIDSGGDLEKRKAPHKIELAYIPSRVLDAKREVEIVKLYKANKKKSES